MKHLPFYFSGKNTSVLNRQPFEALNQAEFCFENQTTRIVGHFFSQTEKVLILKEAFLRKKWSFSRY